MSALLRSRRPRLVVAAALLALVVPPLVPAVAQDAPPPFADPSSSDDATRPLFVAVVGVPLVDRDRHTAPDERRALTEGWLSGLRVAQTTAIALVDPSAVRDDVDRELCRGWVEEGHELGVLASAPADDAGDDPTARCLSAIERGHALVSELLEPLGDVPRLVHLGAPCATAVDEAPAAIEDHLAELGLIALPVTIPAGDGSIQARWLEAFLARDVPAMSASSQAFTNAVRASLRHHAATGDALLGRTSPHVLALRAHAMGAVEWTALLEWAERELDARFSTASLVLADEALAAATVRDMRPGWGVWEVFAEHERRERATSRATELLDIQANAWSRGDLKLFGAAYAPDVVFVTPTGITRGRDDVLARYAKRYPDAEAMGRLELTVDEARALVAEARGPRGEPIAGDVAAVHVVARWSLSYDPGDEREDAEGHTLLVFEARGEDLAIVADASM
jgi:hypothetical protein